MRDRVVPKNAWERLVIEDELVARDPWRGVHDAIRASIISGEYPPGTRLVEQLLADRFGTSRGPVRTALQELERTGLVVSTDRRGTFVRSLSDKDIEEIHSLWMALLEFAVRRAASRIGEQERQWLAEFEAKLADTTGSGTEPGVFLELAIELGRGVFRMADHRMAMDIFETLLVQARAQALFLDAANATGFLERQEGRTFAGFCQALMRGDADAALAATETWFVPLQVYFDQRRSAS